MLKKQTIMLLAGWFAIVLNCYIMYLQKEQFISIFLLLFVGVILTFMFIIERKETLSHNVNRAIAFSFEIGVLYLIVFTVMRCINMAKIL